MDINVKELMGAQEEKSNLDATFVMPQGASFEDAQKRLNVLIDIRDQLFIKINATNTGCVPGAWRDAYSDLTIALEMCVKAEKEIILNA